jgi:hypothetical protein
LKLVLPAVSAGLQIITGGILQIADPNAATALAPILPDRRAATIGVKAKNASRGLTDTITTFALESSVAGGPGVSLSLS